jgi:Ricin-type beta-trefoil lectin domain
VIFGLHITFITEPRRLNQMKLSSRLFKTTLVVGISLLTSFVATTLGATQAKAELISVRDYNFSLNTNANYRLIDGSPRLSMYQSNPNDGDQNFYAYDVPGGRNIKHIGLNKCLNAHYKYSGAEINTWACNPNDPDQLWENVAKGTDYVLIRLKNTNLCLTANNPPSNGSLVTLQTCYYNIPTNSQDWIGSLNPNSPVYEGVVYQPSYAPPERKLDCGVTQWTWTWWGAYVYHDKCAAEKAALDLSNTANGVANSVPGAANAYSKYIPNFYLQALRLAISFNRGVASYMMSDCANRYGQGYLKFPYTFVGTAVSVTCTTPTGP